MLYVSFIANSTQWDREIVVLLKVSLYMCMQFDPVNVLFSQIFGTKCTYYVSNNLIYRMIMDSNDYFLVIVDESLKL